VDWINEIREPEQLWKNMKEQQAAGNTDLYYLLARRAEQLMEMLGSNYGLCTELGFAHGAKARDQSLCEPGRKVSAIRSYRYHQQAAFAAAESMGEVHVVPEGIACQGSCHVDRQAAQIRSLRDAAEVLLQLDWVDEAWKWQWISESLEPVVQRLDTYDPAHLNLGEAYFHLGDYDRAEAIWRQANGLLNASPQLGERLRTLRLARAERAWQAEDWNLVKSLLEGQVDLSARELVLLGDAQQRQGDINGARGCWEAALLCDQDMAEARARLESHQSG
jgi:tetratricopeptide (TPR) repeat protein